MQVHLLTGVARFNEMTYIFDLLKEQHQFELLFRKGMDKVGRHLLALLATILYQQISMKAVW